MMELRCYQRAAIDACYAFLREQTGNPCIVIPTGGGKTPILATIALDAVNRWSGRVLILSHVKELLQQSADTLQRLAPGLNVGVYSAGLKRREHENAVVTAGIQSIHKRAFDIGAFNLVIVDEAHLIPPSGDGMYRKFLGDMQLVNPSMRTIGLRR